MLFWTLYITNWLPIDDIISHWTLSDSGSIHKKWFLYEDCAMLVGKWVYKRSGIICATFCTNQKIVRKKWILAFSKFLCDWFIDMYLTEQVVLLMSNHLDQVLHNRLDISVVTCSNPCKAENGACDNQQTVEILTNSFTSEMKSDLSIDIYLTLKVLNLLNINHETRLLRIKIKISRKLNVKKPRICPSYRTTSFNVEKNTSAPNVRTYASFICYSLLIESYVSPMNICIYKERYIFTHREVLKFAYTSDE